MLINPSRGCYAYADIGPQEHLEIRKVAGRLQPVLCTTEGEQLIASHNLPNLRSDHDLTQVISKLARGYVMVAYSSGEWHVTYQSKRHARGFSPLVIPPQQAPRTETQEAAREGRDASADNSPVRSNLHNRDRSHPSSHSHESSTELVEEGGAPGENIPPSENRGNVDPRLNPGANSSSSQGAVHNLNVEAITAVVRAVLEPHINRMESAVNDVRTDISLTMNHTVDPLRDDISGRISKEFVESETKDYSQEESDKTQKIFIHRSSTLEKSHEIPEGEMESAVTLIKSLESRVSSLEESTIDLKKSLESILGVLGDLAKAQELCHAKVDRIDLLSKEEEEKFERRLAEQTEKIDFLKGSMPSLATQLKRDITQDIFAKMLEEFVNSEDRARRERAEERAADKQEAREDRAAERAADREEAREERARESTLDKAEITRFLHQELEELRMFLFEKLLR